MRIVANGYKRNAGDTVIIDYSIQNDDSNSTPDRKIDVKLERRIYATVLNVGPVSLALSGRYWINVEFSDEDITRLFLLANPEFASKIKAAL